MPACGGCHSGWIHAPARARLLGLHVLVLVLHALTSIQEVSIAYVLWCALQPLVGRGGLVQRCWVQDPAQRPDFATIEAEVEAMLRGRNSMTIGGSD
eukprot:COSAG01_NODE_4343_length_5118_cov_2.188683_3_plen_97_part_00